MARNFYGFIQKKYRQPFDYRNYFNNWCAIYHAKSGKEIMIEARTHFLSRLESNSKKIDHYEILLKEPTCRRTLAYDIKSQKKAVELLEKYIEKY